MSSVAVPPQPCWLSQRLQASGTPVGFATVMEWLLSDPQHGYYGSGQVRFGPQGDFVTSPTQGAVFAELLRRQLWPLLEALAQQSSGAISLIEWGPGEGQLLAQLLEGADLQQQPWLQRLELVLVESSPALRQRQQQQLAALDVPCHWLTPEQLAAAPRRGVVLAHELLDALPVQCFELHQGRWHELAVGCDGAGAPCWQRAEPLPAAVLEQLQQLGLPADGGGRPEGWRSEWCPTLEPWLRQARQSLQQGWLLAIDYAMPATRYYAPQRDGGTLLACRAQRTNTDLLADPGRQDITAHVCSSLLEQQAAPTGWQWRGSALQGEVLLQLGLAAEISALSQPGPLDLAARLQRREQLLRLVDPHLLGGFSWFLLEAQSQEAAPQPATPPGWWP